MIPRISLIRKTDQNPSLLLLGWEQNIKTEDKVAKNEI